MERRPHILVVDDDSRLRALLHAFLRREGFLVSLASDAAACRGLMRSLAFDLLVLDNMLPGESGFDLARNLRRVSDVPILMLTAMVGPEHRIAGFECGSDDYVVKPFEPRELTLRIRAILNRRRLPAEAERKVAFGDFRFDVRRRALRRHGRLVTLTASQRALLVCLAERPGKAVARETLMGVLGARVGGRAVDAHMRRLRRRLGDDGGVSSSRLVESVRGFGYRLSVAALEVV